MNHDQPFAVERWDRDANHVEDVLAICTNLAIARAAFREAVRLYPDAVVLLRNRTHLVETHKWPE